MSKQQKNTGGFGNTMKTVAKTTGTVIDKIVNVFRIVYSFISRNHKIFLAIPVIVGAVVGAHYSMAYLPEPVGIFIQQDGTFRQYVSREAAVMAPIAVTAVCLLLMFCSRRTLWPWVVSLFSLLLPAVIIFTNLFPG